MSLESLFLLPLIVAGGIAYALTPLAIAFAWRFGLIDDPKKNRHPKVIHTKPIPRGGGLSIYIAIAVAALIFLPLDQHLTGILLGGLVLLVLGLADDKYDINPYLRLIIQFAAASMPIMAGIGIAFVSNPLGGALIDLSNPRIYFELFGEVRSIWIFSDVLAVLWIVALMNFLNMGAKGVDGQLTGVVVVAASVIAFLSLNFSADITEWPVIILAAVTAGAFLGFLPFHKYPQKIMPSFSGSNLGGYMLGVLSILTTTKIGILTIVLGVPVVDTGYTVVRRVMSGKSPVWGDRGHLHHLLLDRGWSKARVAYFYWAVTALLGVLAIQLTTITKIYTIVGIVFIIGGLLLWLNYLVKTGR